MIIKDLFPVIRALPVIPAAEPESQDGGPFLDSGSPDRCLRGNDIFQVVLF